MLALALCAAMTDELWIYCFNMHFGLCAGDWQMKMTSCPKYSPTLYLPRSESGWRRRSRGSWRHRSGNPTRSRSSDLWHMRSARAFSLIESTEGWLVPLLCSSRRMLLEFWRWVNPCFLYIYKCPVILLNFYYTSYAWSKIWCTRYVFVQKFTFNEGVIITLLHYTRTRISYNKHTEAAMGWPNLSIEEPTTDRETSSWEETVTRQNIVHYVYAH